MSLIDVADGLRGFVSRRALPTGGVRRVHRVDDGIDPKTLAREHRREIHTRYLEKSRYREKNREKIAAQMRAWRAANPDKAREYRKRWAERNKERADHIQKASRRRWAAKNREKRAAYDRRYQAAHRERLQTKKRAWYAANKDRINAARRRKRKSGGVNG